MPPGASREGAKRRWGNFLQHKIYKNYVSSDNAGMDLEGQIMCIKRHILDVIIRGLKMHQNRWRLVLRPRPHQGSLHRSPGPLTELKKAYF